MSKPVQAITPAALAQLVPLRIPHDFRRPAVRNLSLFTTSEMPVTTFLWVPGHPLDYFTQGRMTYQLRRLRLHGLIALPKRTVID